MWVAPRTRGFKEMAHAYTKWCLVPSRQMHESHIYVPIFIICISRVSGTLKLTSLQWRRHKCLISRCPSVLRVTSGPKVLCSVMTPPGTFLVNAKRRLSETRGPISTHTPNKFRRNKNTRKRCSSALTFYFRCGRRIQNKVYSRYCGHTWMTMAVRHRPCSLLKGTNVRSYPDIIDAAVTARGHMLSVGIQLIAYCKEAVQECLPSKGLADIISRHVFASIERCAFYWYLQLGDGYSLMIQLFRFGKQIHVETLLWGKFCRWKVNQTKYKVHYKPRLSVIILWTLTINVLWCAFSFIPS